MLVLTRKVGEEICIGDNVVVTLVRSENGKARIGIAAPKDLPVNRREIADRIARQIAEGIDDQDDQNSH